MGIRGIAVACGLAMSMFCTGTALAGEKDGSKTAASDGAKRICRTVVVSGSRLGTRVCQSKSVWDAAAERAQKKLDDHQREGTARDGAANGYGQEGAPR